MDQPVVHGYFRKWATLQEWSSWTGRTATYDQILALLTTANVYSQKLENLPWLPSQSSEHQVSRLILVSVRLLLQSLGLVLLQPQEYREIAKVSWISGVRLLASVDFMTSWASSLIRLSKFCFSRIISSNESVYVCTRQGRSGDIGNRRLICPWKEPSYCTKPSPWIPATMWAVRPLIYCSID